MEIKNGIKSLVINNFFEVINFKYLLDEYKTETKSTNLEDIYFELYKKPIV